MTTPGPMTTGADKPRIRVPAGRRAWAVAAAPVSLQAAAIGSSFEGARNERRLANWTPPSESVNTLLASGGELLRGRCRQACRDNPYLASAQDSWASWLVGTGVEPSSLVDDPEIKREIDALWRRSTDELDYDGLTDFQGQQLQIGYSLFASGEAFARFMPAPSNSGLAVPLQIQLIDAPQLPLHLTQVANTGNPIRCGIEFDRVTRKRVAYHFLKEHPGDSTDIWRSGETIRIPAAEILHVFRPTEIGQIRGVPHPKASLVRAFLLDQYDDASLEKAKVAALFVAMIEKAAVAAPSALAAQATNRNDGTARLGLQPGALLEMNPGEKATFGQPADVGANYEAFQHRNLLAVAAGAGVPYSKMTGDLSLANYSSERAGQIEFKRRLLPYLWMSLIFQFVRPVRQRWIETAVLAGSIRLKDFGRDPARYMATKYITPAWEWVDPLKDGQSAALAEDRGWFARSDIIEGMGEDATEVDRRRAADAKRERDMGLERTPSPLQSSPPDNQPATDGEKLPARKGRAA